MFNAHLTCRLLSCLGLLLVIGSNAQATQNHYPTPEAAAQALVNAAAKAEDDKSELKALLGPDAAKLLSGDAVADRAALDAFIEKSVARASIEMSDEENRAQLLIGEDDWPFAIPLIKEAQGWRFDTAAGLEEVYRRRIGDNELTAIAVLRAYVEAQQEYAAEDRDGDGVKEFAQRINSSEGKQDGLYWPASEGAAESPLGPLVADAVTEGYGAPRTGQPRPYKGYFFRILASQGEHASGGAKSYLQADNMTEGFAMVAYPATYGNSGIMSFIVNQRGVVFDADLGEKTVEQGSQMAHFDPAPNWSPVKD